MKHKTVVGIILGIIVLVLVVVGIVFVAPGPIQSHRSYHIQPDPSSDPSSFGKTYSVHTPNEYSFSIVDDQGRTLKDFATTHTKQMHVIVARKDLKYFQHIHPDYDTTTGTFTLKDLTFPADGEYRIFADFAANEGMMDAMGMPLGVTISEDVVAGNLANYKPEALGSEEKTKMFDGYQVSLATDGALTSGMESMLMFTVTQNGKAVTDLEPYLGALGHSVILREGTLDFIHAHPIEGVVEGVTAKQNGTISFMVNFPESGKYKVFTQFQKDGKVFTTDFVVSVAQGAHGDTGEGDGVQGMDH